jgi:hypothetical protein
MDITYLSDTDNTGYVEDVKLHEPIDTDSTDDTDNIDFEDIRLNCSKINKHTGSDIIKICEEIDLICASIYQCQNINYKYTN